MAMVKGKEAILWEKIKPLFAKLMQEQQLTKLVGLDRGNYIVQSRLKHYEDRLTSDHFSIKSVKQGVERYTISGVDHPVPASNFVIVNPQQEVKVLIDSPSEVVGICYFFEPQLIQQIQYARSHALAKNLEEIKPTADLRFHNTPIHAFQTFLKPHLLHTPPSSDWEPLQISEYLLTLAEEMLQHQSDTQQKIHQLEGARQVTKTELYQRLQRGRQFIHEQFQEAISLKEIAREACLSEYYFHRNFRHYFGQTPYQYLHLLRMNLAQELFASGKWTKKEIAAQCGYQDSKYFSKSYKKWLLHRN